MKRLLKSLLGLTIVVLSLSAVVSSAMALLPGDLLWGINYSPSRGKDSANGVAVDGTGVYVVGYSSINVTNTQWLIQKRNLVTGAPIWTRVSNPSAGDDRAVAVARDATGVYIVGYDSSFWVPPPFLPNTRWRMEKRNLTTGALIWTWAFNPSDWDDKALGVAVSSAGVYVVGYGSVSPYGDTYWLIQKRSPVTGYLLASMIFDPSRGCDMATGVAVDGTGFYVVGFDSLLGAANTRWLIQKRSLKTGAPIWISTSNPSAGDDRPTGVAVSSTGVYVVGYDSFLGKENLRWRFARVSPATGAFIWPWTGTYNPSAGPDRANAVAVDSTGFYVVGTSSISAKNSQWLMQKRNLYNGAIIWSKFSNPTVGLDWANGVAVSRVGVYIVGYYGGAAGWRIERRSR